MSNERNHRVRFCDNNFLENDLNAISFSSQKTGLDFNYCRNPIRGLYWTPDNNFTIELGINDKIYINDGSLLNATLTPNNYTGTTLATHIQNQLNAISTSWLVTYNITTKKFSIQRTAGATRVIVLSNQVNAIWNDIGFTSLIDLDVSTSQIADERRNHNFEYVKFDIGYNGDGLFFALIGPKGEAFSLSPSAIITIQGNSIDDFNSPPFERIVEYTDEGFFGFFDDEITFSYRFWRVKIDDRTNNDPDNVKISHIFLGNYTTFTTRNMNQTFSFIIEDLSDSVESVNGSRFFNEKPKRKKITSAGIDLIDDSTKSDIYALIRRVGKTRSFYFSADPTNSITDNLKELTFYAHFDGDFVFDHVFRGYFNFKFSVIEAN